MLVDQLNKTEELINHEKETTNERPPVTLCYVSPSVEHGRVYQGRRTIKEFSRTRVRRFRERKKSGGWLVDSLGVSDTQM